MTIRGVMGGLNGRHRCPGSRPSVVCRRRLHLQAAPSLSTGRRPCGRHREAWVAGSGARQRRKPRARRRAAALMAKPTGVTYSLRRGLSRNSISARKSPATVTGRRLRRRDRSKTDSPSASRRITEPAEQGMTKPSRDDGEALLARGNSWPIRTMPKRVECSETAPPVSEQNRLEQQHLVDGRRGGRERASTTSRGVADQCRAGGHSGSSDIQPSAIDQDSLRPRLEHRQTRREAAGLAEAVRETIERSRRGMAGSRPRRSGRRRRSRARRQARIAGAERSWAQPALVFSPRPGRRTRSRVQARRMPTPSGTMAAEKRQAAGRAGRREQQRPGRTGRRCMRACRKAPTTRQRGWLSSTRLLVARSSVVVHSAEKQVPTTSALRTRRREDQAARMAAKERDRSRPNCAATSEFQPQQVDQFPSRNGPKNKMPSPANEALSPISQCGDALLLERQREERIGEAEQQRPFDDQRETRTTGQEPATRLMGLRQPDLAERPSAHQHFLPSGTRVEGPGSRCGSSSPALDVACREDVDLNLDAGIRPAGMIEEVDAVGRLGRQEAEQLPADQLQMHRLPPPVVVELAGAVEVDQQRLAVEEAEQRVLRAPAPSTWIAPASSLIARETSSAQPRWCSSCAAALECCPCASWSNTGRRRTGRRGCASSARALKSAAVHFSASRRA